MVAEKPTRHIIQSLVVNIIIASAKGFGAFLTGSGALLAETIHSFADCTNQLLLLLGVRKSAQEPTPDHPLGYGRVLYFWSFMVALLLFTGGGVFSIYEGFHKFHAPESVEYISVGIGLLLFALMLEGYATISNLKEMKTRRGSQSLFHYLHNTKDSDLVVVFGENSAATLGLLFALAAQVLAWLTGDTRWDAIGCLAIGVVLVIVALFLCVEIKSLLVGESASPHVEATIRELAKNHPGIQGLLHMIAIQQGPGQVLLLIKLAFNPALDVGHLSDTINAFEDRIRARLPEVRWCFIEPDRPRT